MILSRIAKTQTVLAAAGTLAAYLLYGEPEARALCYGAMIALTNTLLLLWRQRKVTGTPVREPRQDLNGYYRSFVERFFVAATVLAAGLGWLKLLPAPLLVGFVLGQLVWMASPLLSELEKK